MRPLPVFMSGALLTFSSYVLAESSCADNPFPSSDNILSVRAEAATPQASMERAFTRLAALTGSTRIKSQFQSLATQSKTKTTHTVNSQFEEVIHREHVKTRQNICDGAVITWLRYDTRDVFARIATLVAQHKIDVQVPSYLIALADALPAPTDNARPAYIFAKDNVFYLQLNDNDIALSERDRQAIVSVPERTGPFSFYKVDGTYLLGRLSTSQTMAVNISACSARAECFRIFSGIAKSGQPIQILRNSLSADGSYLVIVPQDIRLTMPDTPRQRFAALLREKSERIQWLPL